MGESISGEFRWPLRVYIEDTDAGGIVYYVNYLKYMERARTELLRSMGYGKAAIFSDNLMFVVYSAQVTYKESAVLDDNVIVTAKVIDIARTNVLIEQKVLRDEKVLCEGEIRIACVDKVSRRPAAIPAVLQEQFRR